MSQSHVDFKKSKLSVVVPVFNEASNIIRNLGLLIAEIEQHFTNFEIIVVSDGSTDATNDKLLAFRHPWVRPILVEENAGKGNSVRSGFQSATGDYILFIDGGMEIHPKEIRVFVGLMSLYQCDIVIGSKRHPQSKVEYPWYRRLLSWTFQIFVRSLFHIHVTDTQVGIKLFRRAVIDAVLPHLEINRYGFDLELLSLAKLYGFDQVLEAPIRLDYFGNNHRFVGTDLVRVFKMGFSLLVDTVQLYLRLRKIKINDQAVADSLRKRAG